MRTPDNGLKNIYPERSGVFALLNYHGCQAGRVVIYHEE